MEKLHFKTNVQIKSIIGKDLINDDNIAILELVKNSFDADAKRVDISFCNLKSNDDKGNDTFSENTSRLFIRDDGVGMDLTDITDKWLNIAYSEKKSRSRQFNRMMAGAKGVGRFSCDRLGQFLRLYAKKNGEKCIVLNIDWRKFEIDDKTKEIQSVDINYELIDDNSLAQKGFHGFEHGVILEIIKLRSNWVYPDGSVWDTDKLSDLKKYLEKLINPNQAFEKNDFGIYLNAAEFVSENESKSQNEKFIGKVENTIFQKLDFKTTSIECKSIEDGRIIQTTLKDKGDTIFWIKEVSDYYPEIKEFKITLYYLNTYAKAFFTKQTGMRSVSYGSVFLFLNGFRIPPYGEEGDDWLKLEQRRSQGYKRFISARDLVGQIEILDSNNSFQIVSSREGLVKNDNYEKLAERNGLFYRVLRRLEKYVVDGLNWDSIPDEDKNKVSEIEKKIISGELSEEDLKYQEDAKTKRRRIYESIHSIINASPKKVVELYINEDLIESKIIEEKELAEQEFSRLLFDFENKKISGDLLAQILQKKAQKSKELEKQLADFSKYTTNEATAKAIAEIQSYKDTIEKQAAIIESLQKQLEEKEKERASAQSDADERIKEAEKKRKEAERKAEEERRKAEKEEIKRKEAERRAEEERWAKEMAERERDIQIRKNKYLSATRHLTPDVRDILHVIKLSSDDAIGIISTAKFQLSNNKTDELRASLDEFEYHINKINKLSRLITKADLTLLTQTNLVDISTFIEEYLNNFKKSFRIQYHSTMTEPLEKKIPILDLSIVLDNLKSNSEKAGATELRLDFSREGRTYIVDFSDNGVGVDLNHFTPESIFEEGITNRRGGSGIGLSTIRERMRENLNGNIEFLGNGLHFDSGATFRLTFE
ncbi:MAG: ATP-binding protein [Paludibacteraceae bacterium]|nr:ATP-binding protein [Paludibacteraceae bacterium]